MTSESTSDNQEIADLRRRLAELEEALEASRQREEALRESEARISLMAHGSDDGGFDWNIVTGDAYLSPRWFRIVGYEPGELPNNADSWIRLIHPEDAARVNETIADYFEGRIPAYEIEYRLAHKSGKWIWIMARGKLVRDEHGKPMRMTGMISDITRRREAEEEVRRSERLLVALIDRSPAVIHVRDSDGRFLLANKNYAEMFNLDRRQILGRADHEVLSPEVLDATRASDRVVLDTGESISGEKLMSVGGEPRSFLWTKFPLHDEEGKLLAIGEIITDVTDLKTAEEERAALQQRVITAQRLALRELSTPIIPIAEDVVVMPLIGAIDSQRAQQFMEVLLDGVVAHRAATVIIDVTGVQVVDTQVAEALVRVSRAVNLLGAEVVLTGIRPEVARTLVEMGADLGNIVVHGSLRSGIAHALGRDTAAPRSYASSRELRSTPAHRGFGAR